MSSQVSEPIHGASTRWCLAILLWAWYTALAVVVALPYFAWLWRTTGVVPGTDALLDGMQFGALFELLQASRQSIAGIAAAVVSAVGLAFLSNALLSGGILSVILEPPGRGKLLATFFHGAGRFFLRSLGLLAVTYTLFLVACGAALAVLAPGLSWLLDPVGEPGSLAWAVIITAVVCALAGLFQVGLDYSRVLLVRDDTSGVLGTWLRGALFVIRHPVSSVRPGVAYGGLIVVAVVAGGWLGGSASPRSLSVSLLTTLGQQALLVGAVWLRLAMLTAEAAALGRRWPPEAVAEPAVEPLAEPTIGSEAVPLP